MKISVLGAGVVGLTTAWWLTEAGHEIVLIDGAGRPAAGASGANGAQLSYRYVAPMASPKMLRQLPGLLLPGEDAIKVSLDTELIGWGLRFLKACTGAEVARTTAAQLALAELSRAELERLLGKVPLDFGLRTAGKLVIFRKAADFVAATPDADDPAVALTPRQCLELEPNLALDVSEFAGGLYTSSEQVGDCGSFCEQLFAKLKESNRVDMRMDTAIGRPVVRNRRMTAIETDRGVIEADQFVLSLGSGARAFAKSCGFNLPIYPVKGHSITVPDEGKPPLTHSVTDYSRKIVYAPLPGATRIAGFADFQGYDTTPVPSRIAQLKAAAADTFDIDTLGDVAASDVAPWAGLRPMTPDSRPVIGPSPLEGLFLNTGQGMLGWTLACGSARLTADLIDGKPPSCPVAPFDVARFS
ncbi:FAD-dependent oxidoreductase [Undibacter mobilis]|uniref:FAD-dependent oxidoreductase n=1 Tax=Undibacter mobilis TaxID=2292256 RepID=A0A371B9W5_9BRAD|nr:FAD-dependent oxidoreductase [Undibacter mobilis]RDV04332.1 FAD-dependent oxidoreductase [Undibacter mobilis]